MLDALFWALIRPQSLKPVSYTHLFCWQEKCSKRLPGSHNDRQKIVKGFFMKIKRKYIWAGAILLLCFAALAGMAMQKRSSTPVSQETFLFDTVLSISIYDSAGKDPLDLSLIHIFVRHAGHSDSTGSQYRPKRCNSGYASVHAGNRAQYKNHR